MQLITALSEKIKKLIEYFKHHKVLAAILFFVLVLTIVLLIDAGRLSGTIVQDPFLVSPISSSSELEQRYIKLVSTNPESGVNESLDLMQDIEFRFSVPIEKDSIKVTVRPYAPFKILYTPDDPYSFRIFPTEGWQPSVKYQIHVRRLEGIRGGILEKSVKYNYEHVVPDTRNYMVY